MPSCPQSLIKDTAEVIADVLDVECIEKVAGCETFKARLKIKEVLRGTIDKDIVLTYSRCIETAKTRPQGGAFLKGDQSRIKISLCKDRWLILSSNDRVALRTSSGLPPSCGRFH
jgi:hypothetical protein